jgi:peroxiredoxin Q/BCP
MEYGKAPFFRLPDQNGKIHTNTDFLGKKILLYFYPKDMTPGCTTEALGFEKNHEEFKKQNTVILGVSQDSVDRHKKFCDKHNLSITLLSDESTNTLQDYGVYKEKSMFGKKYMGINRESFLINEEGSIIHHWSKVSPITHPDEVLEFIKNNTQ